MKERVIRYIRSKYTEAYINEMIDAATPDFLDDDWQDEFEDEFEAYQEQGSGEVEAQVRGEIAKDVLDQIQMYDDRFELETGVSLDDLIIGIFEKLDA